MSRVLILVPYRQLNADGTAPSVRYVRDASLPALGFERLLWTGMYFVVREERDKHGELEIREVATEAGIHHTVDQVREAERKLAGRNRHRGVRFYSAIVTGQLRKLRPGKRFDEAYGG